MENKNNLLCISATEKIVELIGQGWEFTLHYGDNSTWQKNINIKDPCWEADFTRLKDDGLWDNHKSGYGSSPDIAIDEAYQNIKNGVRLNDKS